MAQTLHNHICHNPKCPLPDRAFKSIYRKAKYCGYPCADACKKPIILNLAPESVKRYNALAYRGSEGFEYSKIRSPKCPN